MASFLAEGPPQARRRRLALSVALSLAVHVAGVGLLLLRVARPTAREGGEPPGDYVDVIEADDPGGPGAPAEPTPSSETGEPAPVRKPPPRPRVRSTPAAPAPAREGGPAPADAAVARAPPPDAGIAGPPAGAGTSRRADPDQAARAAFRATLRRHMREAWQAYEVYQRIDPQRRLQGSLFATGIDVRLRPDGSIARSELASSSGVKELDSEALAALKRMRPLPPLPPAMIDAEGGWNVRCRFFFDVGLLLFAAKLRVAIAEIWRPSRAFAATAEQERTTVLRLTLARDGKLIASQVAVPSGLAMLDDNAQKALAPGMALPPPPPAFTRQPGPAQVMVAFLHRAGQVRMLRPREDVEEE